MFRVIKNESRKTVTDIRKIVIQDVRASVPKNNFTDINESTKEISCPIFASDMRRIQIITNHSVTSECGGEKCLSTSKLSSQNY